MKKKILTAAVACCLLFTLAACSGTPASTASAATSASTADAATLERYDYVADMNGNTVDITIAQNLKSAKLEIKSMKLDLTALCTVEGNTLTLTELAEGNEQFYKGLSATPYTLNADGTATPNAAAPGSHEAEKAEEPATLERYDYVADMNGNTVDFTIAQNLKSVKCEIKSMGLDLTCYCTVEDGVMTLTELVEGNEQFYSGLSAAPYTLNADGTAVPIQE